MSDNKAVVKDGPPSNGTQPMRELTDLDFPINADASFLPGRISYDPLRKTHLFHTGFGVKIDAGEVHIPFYNNCGFELSDGDVVNVAGASPVNEVLQGCLADASNPILSSAIIGVCSAPVADDDVGLATLIGRVSSFDTSGLTEGGLVYLSDITAGKLTNIRPQYPSKIVIVGSCIKSDVSDGLLQAQVVPFQRVNVSANDIFTSQGIGAGTYYSFGHYDWSATSATLTQASPSLTYGAVGRSQAAHIGIVPNAVGTVDTGQVGVRVTGIQDTSTGAQVAAQTAVIFDDITALNANEMVECVEKFSGNVTIELFVVSGTPTTYSLTFNYGFSKYEDFFNRDATLLGFQARWAGDANDSGMNIELIPHQKIGWTYSAAGFVPGATPIADRLTDQALAPDVDLGGASGSWKPEGLNHYLESGGDEGFLVRLTTTANNTFLNLNMIAPAVSEELV